VADRTVAETQGEAPPGDHRHGGLGTPAGRPRRRHERILGRHACRRRGQQRISGRPQGVEDGLVADRASAPPGQPVGALRDARGEGGKIHSGATLQGEPALDQGRAVERPGGPADAGHQDVPDPPDQLADPFIRLRRLFDEVAQDRLQARRHVGPMVAVAKGSVEAIEERLVATHDGRRAAHEADHVVSRDHGGPEGTGGPEGAGGSGGSAGIRWAYAHRDESTRRSTARRDRVIALVLVGHSRDLVAGLATLIRQAAPAVRVSVAGGTEAGALGTSAPAVCRAVEDVLGTGHAPAAAGAVVLLDFNSAALAVEIALEDLPAPVRAQVRVSRGPLVEGAMAAAIAAGAGASLADVLAASQDDAAFSAGKLPRDWPADGSAPIDARPVTAGAVGDPTRAGEDPELR
jgi:dihydroxyacetone kinase DhaKLM complex PTS-EIIA-like component DhaM